MWLTVRAFDTKGLSGSILPTSFLELFCFEASAKRASKQPRGIFYGVKIFRLASLLKNHSWQKLQQKLEQPERLNLKVAWFGVVLSVAESADICATLTFVAFVFANLPMRA